jgi:hypothetical protein
MQHVTSIDPPRGQAAGEAEFVRRAWPLMDHAARWRAVRARLNPHDALRRTLLELIEGPVVRITDAVVFADRGHRARERRR